MELCIQDFLEFDYFKSLEVLAGADGLTGAVDSCGILDYELEQGLNKNILTRTFIPVSLYLHRCCLLRIIHSWFVMR